jgi:hypothetical protein
MSVAVMAVEEVAVAVILVIADHIFLSKMVCL